MRCWSHSEAPTRRPFALQEDARFARAAGLPKVMSAAHLLRRRECGGAGSHCFSAAQRSHLCSFLYRPMRPSRVVDRMASRAYIGQYSAEGNIFVGEPQQQAWLPAVSDGCPSVLRQGAALQPGAV